MPSAPRDLVRKPWQECIRHFTPAWHTVIMGTGVVSILAHSFPYGQGTLALRVITLLFFFINLLLFVVITGMTAARYIMFPGVWSLMLRHPAQSLFIGAFPMGGTTLINVALIANQEWKIGGTGLLYTLWGLWWLDCLISYLTAFGMLYWMVARQNHSLDAMASVWLLPVVTLVVASSSGGLLSSALASHSVKLALLTTTFSFTMLAIGLTLALMIITIYLQRLVLHGPPDVNLILSAFVVLGPLGQGGYSLLVNGDAMFELLPKVHTGSIFIQPSVFAQIIYGVCLCGSWILWSMGICWIIIASFSIFHVIHNQRRTVAGDIGGSGIPFSLAYWGLIFPNGVFAVLCVQLSKVLNSSFFRVLGAIWSILVLILWLFIFARTIPAVWDTSIFKAPCLPMTPSRPGDAECPPACMATNPCNDTREKNTTTFISQNSGVKQA